MDWNDVFEYRDGLLYWKIKTNRNMKIGRLAGSMAVMGTCRFIALEKCD